MRANRNLDVGAIFARVTSFSARRATLVVAVATLLSIAGVVLALMLDPGRTHRPRVTAAARRPPPRRTCAAGSVGIRSWCSSAAG